jgi:hypothetical protein
MYRPLVCFSIIGGVLFLLGVILGVRFLVYVFAGGGGGHIQSLILASTLMLSGVMTFIVGLQADIIAANRKLLEDIQYHVRRLDYDHDMAKKNLEAEDSTVIENKD